MDTELTGGAQRHSRGRTPRRSRNRRRTVSCRRRRRIPEGNRQSGKRARCRLVRRRLEHMRTILPPRRPSGGLRSLIGCRYRAGLIQELFAPDRSRNELASAPLGSSKATLQQRSVLVRQELPLLTEQALSGPWPLPPAGGEIDLPGPRNQARRHPKVRAPMSPSWGAFRRLTQKIRASPKHLRAPNPLNRRRRPCRPVHNAAAKVTAGNTPSPAPAAGSLQLRMRSLPHCDFRRPQETGRAGATARRAPCARQVQRASL